MKSLSISLSISALICAAICSGCTTATASKDTVTVKSFLSKISNGTYTNGQGVSLHVDSATPDQQTILGLAQTIASMAPKSGPTNAPAK